MAELIPDEESRDAVRALVYRLRNREPGEDDEVFAVEFITALRGRGWRPTPARRQVWQPPAAGRQPPADGPPPEYRAIRQATEDRLQRHQEGLK